VKPFDGFPQFVKQVVDQQEWPQDIPEGALLPAPLLHLRSDGCKSGAGSSAPSGMSLGHSCWSTTCFTSWGNPANGFTACGKFVNVFVDVR